MDKSKRSSLNAKTETTENEDVNRECVKTKKKKKKRDKYEEIKVLIVMTVKRSKMIKVMLKKRRSASGRTLSWDIKLK